MYKMLQQIVNILDALPVTKPTVLNLADTTHRITLAWY